MKILSKLSVTVLVLLQTTLSIAESNTIWIDVRSSLEHKVSNVEGDPRVDYDEVHNEITALAPDLDTPIYLYCWSGDRANTAKLSLEQLGYTNVSAGGMDEAKAPR